MNASHVLITGVSSGIGFGLAAEYLARGDRVWGVSRRQPDDLVSAHENFRFSGLDLTDEEAVRRELPRLLADCKRLDYVILNAGVLGEIGDLAETPLPRLRSVMETNVWANKTTIDVLFDLDIPVSHVITMSSGASVNGNRGWNGYSISKAALNMLTRLYAHEHAQTHFAAVAPGLVDTAMQDYLCGHPQDERFASLEVLKSKRDTSDMPQPRDAARRLVSVFDRIDGLVESGDFVDIRNLD